MARVTPGEGRWRKGTGTCWDNGEKSMGRNHDIMPAQYKINVNSNSPMDYSMIGFPVLPSSRQGTDTVTVQYLPGHSSAASQ